MAGTGGERELSPIARGSSNRPAERRVAAAPGRPTEPPAGCGAPRTRRYQRYSTLAE